MVRIRRVAIVGFPAVGLCHSSSAMTLRRALSVPAAPAYRSSQRGENLRDCSSRVILSTLYGGVGAILAARRGAPQ